MAGELFFAGGVRCELFVHVVYVSDTMHSTVQTRVNNTTDSVMIVYTIIHSLQ